MNISFSKKKNPCSLQGYTQTLNNLLNEPSLYFDCTQLIDRQPTTVWAIRSDPITSVAIKWLGTTGYVQLSPDIQKYILSIDISNVLSAHFGLLVLIFGVIGQSLGLKCKTVYFSISGSVLTATQGLPQIILSPKVSIVTATVW